MQIISSFIEDFEQELKAQSSAFDGTWVKRMRTLDTRTMFLSIFQMMLQRSCNLKSLSSLMAISENFSDISFAASSFCEARKRFSPYFFVDISQWLYRYVEERLADGKWFGRPIFAIDSTTLRLPRELMAEGFGHEETGSFYPLATVTTLYDIRLGMIYDSIVSQHKSERLNAMQLFKAVPEDGLVIGDRGFFSFELIHEARRNGIDVLVRISMAHAPVEIRELHSNFKDVVVTITPSLPTERSLVANGYTAEPFELRVLRKKIGDQYYILLTSILDKEINHKDFFKLYQSRWDIEESFKLLKAEFKLESFKSKHLNGVLQEIFAAMLLNNLSEGLIRLHLGARTKTITRVVVSILTVSRILRDAFSLLFTKSKAKRERIASAIEDGIGKACSRYRPGRSYPRNFLKEMNPWTRYAKGIRR